MSNRVRRQQKKLERHKKRREAKQRKPETFAWSKVPRSRFGRCWVSAALYDDDDGLPSLVHVLVTRNVGRRCVAGLALVDRTCLGVKDATVFRFDDELQVSDLVDRIERMDPLTPCEPSVAQSVVFHALDYAASLGFEPHPDFDQRVFEPRPEALVDTPLSSPERPYYVAGPNDRVSRNIATLRASVGKNFDYFLPDEVDDTEATLTKLLMNLETEAWDDEPDSEEAGEKLIIDAAGHDTDSQARSGSKSAEGLAD